MSAAVAPPPSLSAVRWPIAATTASGVGSPGGRGPVPERLPTLAVDDVDVIRGQVPGIGAGLLGVLAPGIEQRPDRLGSAGADGQEVEVTGGRRGNEYGPHRLTC